jgi:RHS repeat-associated protein
VSVFGEIWDKGKHLAGEGIGDLTTAASDGLNDLGLHGVAQWVQAEGGKLSTDLGGEAGELQLGQTTDPTQLVHGDPAAIRASASRLKDFSSAFGETASGMKDLDTTHWTGAAADAFRAKFAPHPGQWQDAADATSSASGALASYAATVESAQGQARQAIDLYQQGQQATATAVAAYDQQVASYNNAASAYNAALAAGQNPGSRPTEPGTFTDPGAALREQAQQLLSQARAARSSAASSAAGKVTSATSLAPAEPSFWSQVKDDLSDAGQAGALAGLSLGAGAVDGAAGIVSFVRLINPQDPVNQQNPQEYQAGLSSILSGLAHDVTDPKSLLEGIVGSGWDSDPFQALGKLIPGIALTLATDGSGAAADAGADAGVSLGEDAGTSAGEEAGTSAAGKAGAGADENAAAQGTGDMTKVGDPVNIATGEVVFAQADVNLPAVLPLVIERVHRSSQRAGRCFGENWVSTLDQRLVIIGDRVAGVFADGRVLLWERGDLDDGQALPVAGPPWTLSRDGEAYAVHDPQHGLTWRYAPRPGFWRYAGGQGELPLVSLTDRVGHEVSFAYDGAGQPATVTHSGGYRVDVTAADGRVTSLSLGDVTLMSYQYDTAGQLTGIVNSSGKPLRLSYDGAGRMAGWTDRNGHSFRYAYDELGRCVRGDSPSGALAAAFRYEPGVTRWTDATGAVTSYSLDRLARVSAVTDPLGNVTRFARDDRGRVTRQTDPLGRVTRYDYDAAGRLLAVTRPDGSTARAAYDERGLAVRLTEPDGPEWRQDFDAYGNRIALHAPDGAVTRWSYDDDRHLSAVTGADGSVTRVACDAAGLPVELTAPGGAVTRLHRDPFGRVRRLAAPGGQVTALTWTPDGQPLSRRLPDGATETWTWDPGGNLASHRSPAGAVTTYQYGAFDKVAEVAWPDGTRSQFEYDGELRPVLVAHGGLPWRYAYDPAGRLVTETDYNGAVTRYQRDPAGQVTRRLNAAGQQTLLSYDQLGNIVTRTVGGTLTTFGYDRAGRLTRTRNPDAEVTFTRDALGRVTAETSNGATVATSYDDGGRVTARVTPSGAATAWAYDEAGQPAEMNAAGQAIRFSFGPDGREATRDLPGGLRLAQEWDACGRLTAQLLSRPGYDLAAAPADPGQVLQRRSYAYTPDGFLAGTEDLLTGNRAFGLDASGRVTSADGPGWAERYAYDPLGTVTSAAWPALPPELAGGWLAPALQGPRAVSGTLVPQAGNVSSRYDAAGRLISRVRPRLSRKPETWHYSWDADDRLTTVTVPDGTTWRYAYDPLGRRTAKTHQSAAGEVLSTTRFTWDGLLLAEQTDLSARHQQVTTWTYQPGTFTPVTQSSRTTLRDAPQHQIDEQFHSIITDLVGQPTELIAPDGTLSGYQQHTLWGATQWRPGGASTPLRFPGQYADPETGLHYNNQRYYDPVTATYLTPDPLGQSPAPNPHAYVPNPHTLIDPLGLEPGTQTPGPHLALGLNEARIDYEAGGTVYKDVPHSRWLEQFASDQGAITYRHPLFSDIVAKYGTADTFAPKLIDRVVQLNGRISFSLQSVDWEGALAGKYSDKFTAEELRYIVRTPEARAITTFFHKIVPF